MQCYLKLFSSCFQYSFLISNVYYFDDLILICLTEYSFNELPTFFIINNNECVILKDPFLTVIEELSWL